MLIWRSAACIHGGAQNSCMEVLYACGLMKAYILRYNSCMTWHHTHFLKVNRRLEWRLESCGSHATGFVIYKCCSCETHSCCRLLRISPGATEEAPANGHAEADAAAAAKKRKKKDKEKKADEAAPAPAESAVDEEPEEPVALVDPAEV